MHNLWSHNVTSSRFTVISWSLIHYEEALVAGWIHPTEILMRFCKLSLSNTGSVSEPVWRWISFLYQSLISIWTPSSSPTDNSDTSRTSFHHLTLLFFNLTRMHRGLIAVCTLKYTNARVRSFANELLFNYNFTWTLLISGASRVFPSVRNYSGCNCSACLYNTARPSQTTPASDLRDNAQ